MTSKSLSHFTTVEEWLKWRKEQAQKQWEEESLKEYEDSRARCGNTDPQQGTPT